MQPFVVMHGVEELFGNEVVRGRVACAHIFCRLQLSVVATHSSDKTGECGIVRLLIKTQKEKESWYA